METKITLLKSCLIALFLLISSTAFSATYYACSGGTVTIKPTAPGATITYRWDVKLKTGGSSVLDYPKAITPNASGEYIITMPTATTADAYTIFLISDDSNTAVCDPDVAEQEIIVLPPLAITLVDPTNPAYCGSSTTPSSVISPTSLLTATPFPLDLEYEYYYMVSKDGATEVAGSTYGSMDATTKVYTLTTTTAGSYEIKGYVRYKNVVTGATKLLTNSNGCPAVSTKTVTVTTAPAAPTITSVS